MKKKNKHINSPELSRLVGKLTYFSILWKSWKAEMPPANEQIFVILKLDDGYFPVTAEFLDPKNFKQIKFDDPVLPDIYFGDKNTKRLIAWGKLKQIDAPKQGSTNFVRP